MPDIPWAQIGLGVYAVATVLLGLALQLGRRYEAPAPPKRRRRWSWRRSA